MESSIPSVSASPEEIGEIVVANTTDSKVVQDAKQNGKPADKGVTKQPAQPNTVAGAAAPKLDGAALKAAKKAEKLAKRAQVVANRPAPPTLVVPGADGSQGPKSTAKTGGKDAAAKTIHKRVGSNAGENRPLALRGKQTELQLPAEPPKEDKTVEAFRHLYPKMRTTTIAGAPKDIHPAVLALGLQMSNWIVCGSNARLVATLHVFKQVISSYTTPSGNTLARHFTPHVLSPQIGYLASCRPLSISMGVAIRWLKLKISKVDPDTPDTQAKEDLISAISEFIRDRVTLADKVISERTGEKCIKNGDTILTYAKSSVVQRSLIDAHESGTRFKVIVVDSKLSEGKAMAHALRAAGIPIRQCYTSALPHHIQTATKVLLGAHAMMGDGKLLSRAGTAQVAMLAKDLEIPVIVLCESVKCTSRVALDSTILNEVAPPDELFGPDHPMQGWREVKGLQVLNLVYDVTPKEFLSMIITELGCVPPSSIPILQRLSNNDGQGF